MLDVLGDEYIAQHVQQQVLQEARERAYRRYITDALYAISRQDQAMSLHWSDIDPGYRPARRQESPEEIKSRLMGMLNDPGEEDEPNEFI